MKYEDYECHFDVNKVINIWIELNRNSAICDNKEITVKVKESKKTVEKMFVAENKIICILERVEDGLNYLNSYELVPNYSYRNAFNFIEFLNCEYVIIHCIKELAKIFDVSTKSITEERKCFLNFSYGNGCDHEVFEYVRSLCAVHPSETSLHPTVHMAGEFDCCSRIVWDRTCSDGRDLTAVVYTSKYGKDENYIGIEVVPFIDYLCKWINLLDNICATISSFVIKEKERLKEIKILMPDQFNDYTKYIDNLRKEYERRVGNSHLYLFDYYKKAFQLSFNNPNTEIKKECYKNAIRYMFDFLHKQLQAMDEKQYTGICDLKSNEYTTLFYELYMPIEGRSVFANDRGAFHYADNLNSTVEYDVYYARQVLDELKPLVNEYVEFNNDESKDETNLLLQIATYFDALRQEGYISRSIPNERKFRGDFV